MKERKINMKIEININGINYEGDVTPILTKDTGPKIKKTGFERVSKGEGYYSLLKPAECSLFREDYDDADDAHFKNGNYINKKELAIDYQRIFSLFLNLSRWQAEHDSVPDLKSAFYIRYNYSAKSFYITSCNNRGFFEIPFSSSEKAELAINKFYSELRWCFTEFKPNLKLG